MESATANKKDYMLDIFAMPSVDLMAITPNAERVIEQPRSTKIAES